MLDDSVKLINNYFNQCFFLLIFVIFKDFINNSIKAEQYIKRFKYIVKIFSNININFGLKKLKN